MSEYVEGHDSNSLIYREFERPELILMFGAEECMMNVASRLAEDVENIEGTSNVWHEVSIGFENNIPTATIRLHIGMEDWTPLMKQLTSELLAEGFVYRGDLGLFECRLHF